MMLSETHEILVLTVLINKVISFPQLKKNDKIDHPLT